MPPLQVKQPRTNWILGSGAIGNLIASTVSQEWPCEMYSLRKWGGTSAYEPEFIFFCGKAHQFSNALEHLAKFLETSTATSPALVILSNGLGLYEKACAVWSSRFVCRGIINTGVQINSHHQIKISGELQIQIAKDGLEVTKFNELVAGFRKCGWLVSVENSPIKLEWKKAVVNTVINGLATVHDCENGKLIDDQKLHEKAELLLQELANIAKSNAVGLTDKDFSLVWQVAKNTAQNVNSLLQDVRRGREKNEWHNYGGEILKVAQKNGVEASLLQSIDTIIRKKRMVDLSCI